MLENKKECACGNWYRGNSNKCAPCNTAIVMELQQQQDARIVASGGLLLNFVAFDAVKEAVNEQSKQYYFDCPLGCELENEFFAFMMKHNLVMDFLKEDCNGMPEFRIKGTLHNLHQFIDIVYDSGLPEENDYYKTFIKEL
jgi:hypothetical protein